MASADARAAELVVRYNALIESLRAVHRMLRRGRVSRGIQMLEEARCQPKRRARACPGYRGRASGASCADDAAARAGLHRPLLLS